MILEGVVQRLIRRVGQPDQAFHLGDGLAVQASPNSSGWSLRLSDPAIKRPPSAGRPSPVAVNDPSDCGRKNGKIEGMTRVGDSDGGGVERDLFDGTGRGGKPVSSFTKERVWNPYRCNLGSGCAVFRPRLSWPARPGVPRQWPRARDLLGAGPGGWLNHMPKDCFNDALPAGAAATMSARSSESAMTASRL